MSVVLNSDVLGYLYNKCAVNEKKSLAIVSRGFKKICDSNTIRYVLLFDASFQTPMGLNKHLAAFNRLNHLSIKTDETTFPIKPKKIAKIRSMEILPPSFRMIDTSFPNKMFSDNSLSEKLLQFQNLHKLVILNYPLDIKTFGQFTCLKKVNLYLNTSSGNLNEAGKFIESNPDLKDLQLYTTERVNIDSILPKIIQAKKLENIRIEYASLKAPNPFRSNMRSLHLEGVNLSFSSLAKIIQHSKRIESIAIFFTSAAISDADEKSFKGKLSQHLTHLKEFNFKGNPRGLTTSFLRDALCQSNNLSSVNLDIEGFTENDLDLLDKPLLTTIRLSLRRSQYSEASLQKISKFILQNEKLMKGSLEINEQYIEKK